MESRNLTASRVENPVAAFVAEYLHKPRAFTKCDGMSLHQHSSQKATVADTPARD